MKKTIMISLLTFTTLLSSQAVLAQCLSFADSRVNCTINPINETNKDELNIECTKQVEIKSAGQVDERIKLKSSKILSTAGMTVFESRPASYAVKSELRLDMLNKIRTLKEQYPEFCE